MADVFRSQGQDADEIVSDIEARCAEILATEHDRINYIVTEYDIAQLIDRMGRPEEIIETEIDSSHEYMSASVKTEVLPPSPSPSPVPISKRLYRMPKGKIGGVCAGLAEYFHWDVTYIRLILIALLFVVSYFIVPAYIIAWIVIPVAKTPFELMQLRGQSPTLSNIGSAVKHAFGFPVEDTSSSDEFEQVAGNDISVRKPNKFIVALVKTGLSIIGLVLSLISLSAILTLIFSIGSLFGYVPWHISADTFTIVRALVFLIFTSLSVGIPAIVLTIMVGEVIFNGKSFAWDIKGNGKLAILIIWMFSLVICLRNKLSAPEIYDAISSIFA